MERISWLTQTADQIPPNQSWLSEEERKVLSQFRYPKRRNDWLLGRWAAKQAVHAFQRNADPALSTFEILSAEDGAPEVFRGRMAADVTVSISHSRDRGMCAVAPGSVAVGCDIEWIEPREERFARDYFTSGEMSVLQKAPFGADVMVNLIWSAKECALKVLRTGLSRDTRSVAIDPDFAEQEDSWRSWSGRCLESSNIFYGWWKVCDGYIYALASFQSTDPPLQLTTNH